MGAASGGVEPATPGDIGFHVGVFFQERDEAGPGGSHGSFFFVVVPGNFKILRDAAGQPSCGFEVERVLHGGAGDAGGVEVVEGLQVGEFFDSNVEGVQESFELRDQGRGVREGTEEEESFVEAEEGFGVFEVLGCELVE